MSVARLRERPDALWQLRTGTGSPRQEQRRPVGHAHFWERAMSRRALMKGLAGVGAAAATGGLWMPAVARAGEKTTSAAPKPVPGNPALGGLHVYLPGENSEPSTVTDLNGFVGIGAVTGKGTATLADGSTQPLFFEVDNRFMKGEFVGADGRLHHGTFAFT
ncbi:MAG TPA: hypothetical protein VE776_06385 [Actinomycetota bacterium]|nr:hypothetical protein [Actinomycetota bacterium]